MGPTEWVGRGGIGHQGMGWTWGQGRGQGGTGGGRQRAAWGHPPCTPPSLRTVQAWHVRACPQPLHTPALAQPKHPNPYTPQSLHPTPSLPIPVCHHALAHPRSWHTHAHPNPCTPQIRSAPRSLHTPVSPASPTTCTPIPVHPIRARPQPHAPIPVHLQCCTPILVHPLSLRTPPAPMYPTPPRQGDPIDAALRCPPLPRAGPGDKGWHPAQGAPPAPPPQDRGTLGPPGHGCPLPKGLGSPQTPLSKGLSSPKSLWGPQEGTGVPVRDWRSPGSDWGPRKGLGVPRKGPKAPSKRLEPPPPSKGGMRDYIKGLGPLIRG